MVADLDGWCSVVGHRQMGMTLRVRVTGGSPESSGTAAAGHAGRAARRRSRRSVGCGGHRSERGTGPWLRAVRPRCWHRASDERIHRITLTGHRRAARGGARGHPDAVDLRRHRARPDAARAGGRHVRDHARQRRLDRALDRLPCRRARTRGPMRTIAPGAVADLPVHRDARPASGCTTARRCRCRCTSPTACSAPW